MKLNNREDLTPICATENVPLFVMYVKEELPEKHKSKLESHLSQCADCKMNLAYINEILQFKHHLSIDEKTLLLKYLSDPLFYYFANNIRKKVLEDVKEIVKEAKAKVNEVNEVNNTIDARVKDFGKAEKLPKKLHQQIPYPYLVLTTSIILFLSLGISIVLALSSKYPALQSYLPFSNSTSAVEERLPTNLGSELSINLAKTTEINRYQQLDTAIDEFLATKDRTHLEQAESIAKDIQLFYEDNYGVDLVSYYQSVPESTINNLSIIRKQLQKLINESSGDKYQEHLAESQIIEKTFLSFGNLPEAYKAKALITKLSVQLHKDDAKKIANEGLIFSLNNQYLYLQLDFLLWEAKRLSKIPDFVSAEEKFTQTIDLATKLNLQKIRNSAGASLATIYYQANDNEKAFNLAKKLLLLNFGNYKNPQIIGLLQIAGLSSFNLGYYQLAESYLTEAAKNSQEINSPAFAIRSYSFLGLIFAEQKNFTQAEEFYSKAKLLLSNITETNSRLEALAVIVGYEAKAKLLANDNQQAVALYQQKLDIMEKIKLQSNLETSQIHQAMATALIALGETQSAKEHSTIAKHYTDLAKINNEMANCLLSLAPTKCGSVQ